LYLLRIYIETKWILSTKTKEHSIFHGRNNITCSTNCKYRTAATLYPGNMVCFRYIIVDTLHKCDDDDDNDNNNNNNNNNNNRYASKQQ
jgi:hypothetical protein